jgi:glyoxylase-like metal-dependent hydrolase (beta-lactamase superfamily II)
MNRALVSAADGIWFFPADAEGAKVEPNVGVVVTARGTILIDAGNSPRHARTIRLALQEIAAPPIVYLIYTHHHWDHVFGAQVYEVPAIAHETCRELLVERASRPWGFTYIEEEIRRNPAAESMYMSMHRAVEDWHGFRIVPPSITFTATLTMDMGGTPIELEHVGGQHAGDSIIVRLPAAGVAFVGDCFYKPVPAVRLPDAIHDRALVRRLLQDDTAHTFIDGHRPEAQSRETFARLADE